MNDSKEQIKPSPIKPEYKDISETEFVDVVTPIDIGLYSGDYKINKLGQIKSFKRSKKNGHLLRHTISVNISGEKYYPVVSLYGGDNKKYTVGVHILMGHTFLVNNDPINKTMIDHINNDKQNFSLDNLRFTTPSGNRLNQTSRKNPSEKLEYHKIDDQGTVIERLSREEVIKGYTLNRVLQSIRLGKKYKGYYWREINLEVENYYSRFSDYIRKTEEWEDISKYYPELKKKRVFVSSLGVIKYGVTPRLTLGAAGARGHKTFVVNIGENRYSYRVHVLVTVAFITKRLLNENEKIVDHLNGDPGFNYYKNLSPGTQSDNMSNKITLAKISESKSASPTCRKVDLFSIDGVYIKTYESAIEAAKELECEVSTLNMCIRGIKLTIRGYIALDHEFSDKELKEKLKDLGELEKNSPGYFKSLRSRKKKLIT